MSCSGCFCSIFSSTSSSSSSNGVEGPPNIFSGAKFISGCLGLVMDDAGARRAVEDAGGGSDDFCPRRGRPKTPMDVLNSWLQVQQRVGEVMDQVCGGRRHDARGHR
eukprot:GABV01010451.1.p2 GENE.GABV01010451.1~~GABV01010451.1.p2  ORF type:complete len:107 (+),score=12.64 GABV01010451.1:163-483(+)